MLSKRARVKALLEQISKTQPLPTTELRYTTSFELIVAVILSAQCTDRRVNATTPALFHAFPSPDQMANASFEKLFSCIKSISYPNNKTRYLIEMSRMLVEQHRGEVPRSVSELQKLPGVGRKTAHVVASELYEANVLAVDTHVFRVAHRLRLVSQRAKTPLAVEKELTQGIPQKYLRAAHHWLILHGRYTCTARKPRCTDCPFRLFCPFLKKPPHL